MLTKAELQRVRELREKKHREAEGLFVVEGEKVVSELLAAKFPFEKIYATDSWDKSRAGLRPAPPSDASNLDNSEVTQVTSAEMERMSHFPTPSSVLAVGKIVRTPLAPGDLARGLTLALDGVQDAGNVGTLIRIADWFAIDRVVLSPDCADIFHQKVINASMGSFARMRTHVADLAEVLAGCRVPVLGCDLEGEDVHRVAPLRDGVIVIGSEGRGISAKTKSILTGRITIPRIGGAESLNAAVAAAIVCDNLRRSR
jgi:TrmH family RNA methyltransferase